VTTGRGDAPGFPALPAETELEAQVRAAWERHGVVGRALRHQQDAPESFVFYEGPPTANGRPALHHVFSRTLKDVVCRHRLMTGHRVPRKGGWDTQGLPVEIEVQKELGITTRDEIERLGPDKRSSIIEFNRRCRESVFKYVAEWKDLSLRMAYWLDYEQPYVTYETPYIESCWAILARFHRAGLLKKDFKILPYCPQCQTGLSNHEVALGYEDVQDPSVTVRFRVEDATWRTQLEQRRHADLAELKNVSLLVWTTTPWTLLSNVAVAAHPELEYAVVRHGDEHFVVAAALVPAVLGPSAEVVGSIRGRDLDALRYRRPFENVKLDADPARRDRSSTVRLATYVSAADGTGLVHTAPAFGADDFELRKLHELPILKPVDDRGRFTDEVATDAFGKELVGQFVKAADKRIIKELKERGLLFKQDTLQHAYPHCWRCRSPLIYMARPSWFLLTTQLRDRLVALNRTIRWQPPEIGAGRFGEWLEGNVDWAISRERYWGTPLNVWICEGCGAEHAPESLAEIARRAGQELPRDFDVHRPFIDDLTFPCDAAGCRGTLRRTPEVIDCWFDSGAMPFAQAGWPAALGPGQLPADFPADFISEGLDQTRGWFYTLHVLATFVTGLPEFAGSVAERAAAHGMPAADAARLGLPAYRACLVNNLLLDAQGKKMSKSRGNVVAPQALFDSCGVDAVRWFFLASGQVWTPKRFDADAVTEGGRRVFGTLRNCYAFLALYANLEGHAPGRAAPTRAAIAGWPAIDRWLVSRLETLTAGVGRALQDLELTEATRLLDRFIDAELSNWYVRRNRARFWKSDDAADQAAAFATLGHALERLSLLLAPIAPFLSEWLWRAVTGAGESESVHLAAWPDADAGAALRDAALEADMDVVLRTVELGRSVRAAHDLKVRQPLAALRLKATDAGDAARLRRPDLARLVAEELNVKSVQVVDQADFRTISGKADFKRLGPRLGPRMKAVAAAVAALDEARLDRLQAEGGLELQMGDETLRLERDDVVIVSQGRPGFAVAADGRLVLALDTRLDDALIAEGRARELVNRVQNTRKASGLEVSDRVVVRLAGHADLLSAAARHERLILDEVLGVRLELLGADAERAALATRPGAQSFDVDGAPLVVAVERVEG
jgi:isoleucyl-tRNA synthetase